MFIAQFKLTLVMMRNTINCTYNQFSDILKKSLQLYEWKLQQIKLLEKNTDTYPIKKLILLCSHKGWLALDEIMFTTAPLWNFLTKADFATLDRRRHRQKASGYSKSIWTEIWLRIPWRSHINQCQRHRFRLPKKNCKNWCLIAFRCIDSYIRIKYTMAPQFFMLSIQTRKK